MQPDSYFMTGGSIFGFPGSNYTVKNTVFRDNRAKYGSGITAKGVLYVYDSYFTEHTARFTGGAINTAAKSTAVILNSVFDYNKVHLIYLACSACNTILYVFV
jgi:hypothetical protein